MKKSPVLMLNYALTGIGYGIPVTLLCMTLIGGYQEPIGELAIWTAVSAIIGLLSGLTFGSDKLTMPGALGLHCSGTLAIVVTACWLNGYDSDPIRIFTGVLPVFVIVYAAIYAINYFANKMEEKRINASLNQKN